MPGTITLRLAEQPEALMFVSLKDKKYTGSFPLAISSILLLLACCTALLSQSRLGVWTPSILAPVTGTGFEATVRFTWLVLALSLVLLLYYGRKDRSIKWVGAAFAAFLIVSLLNYQFVTGRLSVRSPLVIDLLALTGCVAALIVIVGLALFMRRLAAAAKDAERAKESELHLLAATESSTDSVIMYDCVRDSDGEISDFRFTFLNRSAERMTGVAREDVLGRNLYEVFPTLRNPERLAIYKSVIETGESALIELTHPLFKTGGKPARHQMQIVKLQDGIVMTITDVTLSLQYKEELKQALNFNKSVIACSPFSIVVTDKTGAITCVNPAAERMLWYQESDLLGQPYTDLHDPREIAQRASELSSQFGTQVTSDHHVFRLTPEKGLVDEREWAYLRKDGSRVPVQLVVSALRDTEDCIVGFLGISYDLTERKRADEYIYHVAHHDPLTGLPTRTLLRDRLEVAIERAKRSQESLAVMMVDLDNFKRVNDSLGHQAGDTVLCEISRRLKGCVRKSDTVARMGGDEFVVLLPDLRASTDTFEICQKLLDSIAQPIRIGRHEIIVTASIGIGLFPDCEDVDVLFKNADLAMYSVKGRGRNGSEIYTPELAMQGLEQLQMESALRNAIDANEFEIAYQPQISFKNQEMLGVEALLRWNSREFGTVMPTTFIPIAEQTGLIVPIGEWILIEACREVAAMQRRLGIQCSVAVNISPRQFQQKNFPATVELALLTSGLKPEQLELEITEQLLMIDSEESLEIMQRVRKLGVRFAIDDFGTGFSNMGYITRFAVDRIKIDRSFISKCDVDGTSRAVTSAIIALAHSLDIEVIAEGVESELHVQMLTQMSCDQAQGYFYSRPLTMADLETFASQSPQKSFHRFGHNRSDTAVDSCSQPALSSMAEI
jgi:diguanylate cyclase (GGDEF)-like protein/PAS domain S-box-containing protein